MKNKYYNYALYMKALSDEIRVKIFEMLFHDELCACKILEAFNITQPTLSYHMKILCESGLIDSRKDRSMTKYSIKKDSFENLREFIHIIGETIKKQNTNIKGE